MISKCECPVCGSNDILEEKLNHCHECKYEWNDSVCEDLSKTMIKSPSILMILNKNYFKKNILENKLNFIFYA